jgi:hypothetical protein
LALVLALLVLTGWGQVHRALHAVTQDAAVAAQQHAGVHAAGHDAGSSLCALLDHLSLGAAATRVAVLPPVWRWPTGLARQAPASVQWVQTAAFDARGPPLLA